MTQWTSHRTQAVAVHAVVASVDGVQQVEVRRVSAKRNSEYGYFFNPRQAHPRWF